MFSLLCGLRITDLNQAQHFEDLALVQDITWPLEQDLPIVGGVTNASVQFVFKAVSSFWCHIFMQTTKLLCDVLYVNISFVV